MLEREIIVRFGQIIEAKRIKCFYTQQFLAHVIGESVIFVQLLEKGRLDPLLSDIEKIAKAFNMSVFDLLKEISIY